MRQLGIFAMICTLVQSGYATVIIGNMPQANDTSISAGLTAVRVKAMGFTTGTASASLASVDVRLSVTAADSMPTFQLRTGMTLSNPGTVVYTFVPPLWSATGYQTYTYFAEVPFTLAPNTTYFLYCARLSGTGTVNWSGSSPAITPTGPGATHAFSYFSSNGTSFNNSVTLNSYQLNGNAPSNTALTGSLNLQDTVGTFAGSRSIGYTLTQGTTVITSGSISCSTTSTPFTISIPTSVTGAATLAWNGSSFLRRATAVTLTGTTVSTGTINAQNGDVDNSGEVDAADIDAVIADFGSTSGADTDVDVSGEVDAADIDIVIANFGGIDD